MGSRLASSGPGRGQAGDIGLFTGLLGDGRPALLASALALLVSGAFAVFLSIRREFLPHDVAHLGMTAEQLCALADCRVVRFMFHDRVAFGGSLVAVSLLYLWLAAFPLAQSARWAWLAFAWSGLVGFGSFLAYFGYGYLDSWHGAATVVLLPLFGLGLLRTRSSATASAPPWLSSGQGRAAPSLLRRGRQGLLATAAGMMAAGAVILVLGTTEVFVAEDLAFMDVTREMLDAVNPRLVPLIAHDRAGFGGALVTTGLLLGFCAWFTPPSRAFHQTAALAGAAGFGCAIGVHFFEGYTNPVHLAPAFAGAALFAVSLAAEVTGARRVIHPPADVADQPPDTENPRGSAFIRG